MDSFVHVVTVILYLYTVLSERQGEKSNENNVFPSVFFPFFLSAKKVSVCWYLIHNIVSK